MTSFIGDYTGKIDTKGRIVVPSVFKRQLPVDLEKKFVIKKDIFEKCLILYTADEWNRQNNILRERINPAFNRQHSKFLREFYRGTHEVSLDANNRILIPARLLEYAEINKEVSFSGQDKRIEIWARDKYEIGAQAPEDFAELAEEIMGDAFGF